MTDLKLDLLQTLSLAALVYFAGIQLQKRIGWLDRLNIPAAVVGVYPALGALNFMRLATPQSAILSAVIFNALVIIALIPLALRGVPYRARPAAQLLRDHLLIYGLGGLVAPFIGIKLIDMLLSALWLM